MVFDISSSPTLGKKPSIGRDTVSSANVLCVTALPRLLTKATVFFSTHRGRTPKGTVQGAISTALALSAALKTFEPIEKQKMNSTTYYRMAEQALLPSEGGDTDPSDAGNNGKHAGKTFYEYPCRLPHAHVGVIF